MQIFNLCRLSSLYRTFNGLRKFWLPKWLIERPSKMTRLQIKFFSDSVTLFNFGCSLINSCHSVSFITSFIFFNWCRHNSLYCILTLIFELLRCRILLNRLMNLLDVYRDSYPLLAARYTKNCVERTVFLHFCCFGANILIMRRARSLVIYFITIIVITSLKLLPWF